MKKKIIFAFAFTLACWLCFPGNSGAQQGYCFNTNFSTYTNVSLGSDGASIVQTVQQSGYITLNDPTVWAGPLQGWIHPCASQNSQMQSVSHTYSVRNVMGSIGGNYSQGPTPALNYNTYSITITAPATPGTIYGSETEGLVTCPIGGIFGGPINLINYEVAFTRFVTAGYLPDPGPPPARYYYTGPYCSRETTPPDWTGTGLWFKTPDPPLVPTDIADDESICARIGSSGPWTCIPYGKYLNSYNRPYPLGICTRNP